MLRFILKLLLTIPVKLVYWTKWQNKKILRQFRKQPVILAVNHRSGWDGPLLFLDNARKLNFWVKGELFQSAGKRWFWRGVGGIPVQPGAELALLRNSQKVFDRHQALVVMPEGHRTFGNHESKLQIRNGIAMVALRCRVPIVPVMMDRQLKPFRVTHFKVGEPLDPQAYLADGRVTKDGVNALGTALQTQMQAMLVNFDRPEKLPAWQTEPNIIARGITIRDGQLLAIKRNRGGEDYYVLPGGHAEPGETIHQTCVREVAEETGVAVRPFRDLYKYWYEDQHGRGNGWQTFYACEYLHGEPHPTDAEEYTQPNRITGSYEPVWINMADLPNLDLRPAVMKKQLIKDYRKKGARLSFPLRLLKDRK